MLLINRTALPRHLIEAVLHDAAEAVGVDPDSFVPVRVTHARTTMCEAADKAGRGIAHYGDNIVELAVAYLDSSSDK